MFSKWLHAAAAAAGIFTGSNVWADVIAAEAGARPLPKQVSEKAIEAPAERPRVFTQAAE